MPGRAFFHTMNKKRKPYGKDEVRAAILTAAEELFSERGVAAVSIRDIAEKADVNHGLVHRHFKSKENLRQEVQERLAKKVRDQIGDPSDLESAVEKGLAAIQDQESFVRVMARTFLDGQFDGDVQSEFPFIKKLVDLAREEKKQGRLPADIDPRIYVAGGLAQVLGLMVFSDYILQGTGLNRMSRSKAIDRIISAWRILNNPKS